MQRSIGVEGRFLGTAETGEVGRDDPVGAGRPVGQPLPVPARPAQAVDGEDRGSARVVGAGFPHVHVSPRSVERQAAQAGGIGHSAADPQGGLVTAEAARRQGDVPTNAHHATLPWARAPERKDEGVSDADVIVMGMGPGGEEVAGRCTDGGLRVLGIERKLVGGECPYWGCVPSKVMVRAADSLAEAARVIGLAGSLRIDPEWTKVASRVREFTADWNDEAAVERHEAKGTKIVRGTARLRGPRSVEVDGAVYEAERGVVIATGGEPAIPPIEGLSQTPYWTNRGAIEATDVPGRLIVLGGGAIGLELAQVFLRFGADVTVVESAARVLALEEPENGEALGRVLSDEGITLRLGVRAERVSSVGDGVLVVLSDGSGVEGDRLLVATGRRSDLEAVGVAAAGLDPSARIDRGGRPDARG